MTGPLGPTMRALLLTGPRQWRVAEVPVPAAQPGHCLVRVAYVGLCGTDLALYDGSSGYLRDGLKRYPFVVGHEWSGTVVEVGPGVQGFAVGEPVAGHNVVTCDTCDRCRSGRRLHCRNRTEIGVLGDRPGVASEYICVPAKMLLPLPASLDLRSAAVLEPATASAHAVSRLGVREGDAVAVLGTGTLGLAAVQISRSAGARVTAVGVDAAGLALAEELGAEAVLRPEEAPDDGYDAVIEASGAEPAIARAPQLVAPGGRLAFLGVPHGPVPAFPSAQLVMKNLEVHGVLSGIEQWDALLRLVVHGHVDLGALIDGVLPLASAGDALTALAEGRRSRPKVLLEIGGRSGSADLTDLTEGAA